MSDATVTELRPSPAKGEGTRRPKDPTSAQRQARFRKKRKAVVTVAPDALSAQIANPPPQKGRDIRAGTVTRNGAADVMAYTAALGLTSVAELLSIKGMLQLFTRPPVLVIAMTSI